VKLIYTLFIDCNANNEALFCGYKTSKDLLDSLLLSSTLSGKHFNGCELYCNSRGLLLIEQDGRKFPFTNIFTILDDLESWLFKDNWAYSKILTYSKQQSPFIHLDCDAILVDGLPVDLLNKKFIFQQEELLSLFSFGYYNAVFKEAKRFNILPEEINYLPVCAMNMGIFGCLQKDYLKIVQQYSAVVLKYLQQQQKEKYDTLYFKKEQSMFFEQLFIVNILLDNGLKKDIDFDTILNEKGKNKYLPAYRYSHFVRGIKRNETVTHAIRKELILLGFGK